MDKTAKFISIETVSQDTSLQVYGLSYNVQHMDYNLTLSTKLIPLDSKTYNSSVTIVSYVPAEETEVTSVEVIEFNSTVSLSQLYASLSKVAKKIGKA
jgi:hypothetical protein